MTGRDGNAQKFDVNTRRAVSKSHAKVRDLKAALNLESKRKQELAREVAMIKANLQKIIRKVK